jgi:flavorubredoxin
MGDVLIVYATRIGETRTIAELIAEGVRISGHAAKVVDVAKISSDADLTGYDAYVFGSATYHGEMMQKMKTLLFMAEKIDMKGKPGGAFGAFGWSGEAPDRIFDTMKSIYGMDMAEGPLRLKSSGLEGGIRMAQEYGKEIAAKIPA